MAFTKATMTGDKDTTKEGWTKFNDLIDDLLATTNGLGASQVGIEDAAGNMSADNVEDALAEIYSDTASTRTRGQCSRWIQRGDARVMPVGASRASSAEWFPDDANCGGELDMPEGGRCRDLHRYGPERAKKLR